MKIYSLILCLFSFLMSTNGQEKLPWKISLPEEQGMNSQTLINGIQHFKHESVNIHSLMIIRNDHIVLDTYFYPFQKDFVHDLASVTKSITSLLIGIAIDEGFIRDEDQLVFQYFPEYLIKNDTLLKLKIKDLINMSSGLRCSWSNGEQELEQMNNSKDWVQFMFDLPFESLPGTRFSYCSGNFYLLAEILQRTTKMTCLDFAKKNLFQPLNFGQSYWENNDKGVNHGWGDLYLSTHDLAKIGYLILNDGKWYGKEIISKKWIEKIKPHYKISGTESYGYGWWLDSENPDEIQAIGRGGQRLFIFRKRNTIIATTGGGYDAGDVDNLILESINIYDKSKNYSSNLDSLSKTIQLPNPDIKIANNSLPLNILNRDIQFEKNDLEIKTIRFEQRNRDHYILISYTDESNEEHIIGMNNEYMLSSGRQFNLPVALKGLWENNKLELYFNELCGINLLKLSFTFSDTSVDLNVNDQTDGWSLSLKGKL